MIFVTVGAQMPFDRLIRAVDNWAASRNRSDIFAQIGLSNYRSKSIKTKQFVEPLEFRELAQAADVIVAHAGMGTIITALEFGKPIIVMPRRGDLKETRNDHQIATVTHLAKEGRITVALDEQQLAAKLNEIGISRQIKRIERYASPQLITTLSNFIEKKCQPSAIVT
jgi:UDP-N-acetylglucosamine transferase subunit ALG13